MPLRLLVVDDSAVVRQALLQILGHAESLGAGGHGFQAVFPTVYVNAVTPVRRAG